MIKFYRDGTQIKVAINAGMLDQKVMNLYWDCGHDWFAEMLLRKLEEELSGTLRSMREDYYRQGWKDAKAKRSKRTFFSDQWNE